MKQLPNILIVDDNQINLAYLKAITNKIEINLIQALSGYEALEKTRGVELALAILDVKMPEMNGYELALKLNEERSEDKVPVIFLTANSVNETEEFKGYNSGAVDYIFKPVNSQILLSKVNVFLNFFEQKKIIVRNAELLKANADELKSSLTQLQQLTQYIEQVRENERIAISRELHDDLGQSLTAVKIELGMIRHKVTDDEVVNKINKVTALVGDTIKTVQRLTSQLRPDIIDDLGIEAAIEWYTNEFSERTGIEISLDMDPGISLSPGDSLIIFRIIQESLTNIARHSKANLACILLYQKQGFISLIISDNGIGVTEEQKKAKNAFGLISMKERAASLGGTFFINSENGKGTEIVLSIPVKDMIL
ncbi:MAG: response regulator [Lentimicrobiaceae bacterium]|jgi:signal transduction histidine kinase